MKKIHLLLTATLALALTAACTSKNFDNRLTDVEKRVQDIEATLLQLNASISALETAKEGIESRVAALESNSGSAILDEVKALLAALDIDALKKYADDLSGGVKDWADTKFATLDNLQTAKTTLDSLKAVVAALPDSEDLIALVENAKAELNATIASLGQTLADMIQTVTIVPAYSDGSVAAPDGILEMSVMVSPAAALAGIPAESLKDSLSILLTSVARNTKAGYALDTAKVSDARIIDPAKGILLLHADINAALDSMERRYVENSGQQAIGIAIGGLAPEPGSSHGSGSPAAKYMPAAALNVRNGISDYTTTFTNVVTYVTLNGIKNTVGKIREKIDAVYARLYADELETGSASFLAGATDEAVNASQNAAVNGFIDGSWSAAKPVYDLWARAYAAIAGINGCLKDMAAAQTAKWNGIEGSEPYVKLMTDIFPYELRFFRAYFHFELFRAYGGVPYEMEVPAVSTTRPTAEDVVKNIIKELDILKDRLPKTYSAEDGGSIVLLEDGTEITRPTAITAEALKARTQFYYASPLFNPGNDNGRWKEAAKSCNEFIKTATDGAGMALAQDSWGEWDLDSHEMIFGIRLPESNDFEKANYPSGIGGVCGNCPTQSLVDCYEYQNNGETFADRNPGDINLNTFPYEGLDPRFYSTIVKNGDIWPANKVQGRAVETFKSGRDEATPTGYYLRKGLDTCITAAGQETRTRHTIALMRLSEFYLDFAEAAFNATGNANDNSYGGMSANEAVNKLRTRASINIPKFMENDDTWIPRYERERMVELAFENHRFWDVRRWKKGETYFNAVKAVDVVKEGNEITLKRREVQRKWENKYYLFPIPKAVMDENPGWEQNPGW